MNSSEILAKIKEGILDYNISSEIKITDIDWIAQTCTEHSVLFIKKGGASFEESVKRIQSSLASLIMTSDEDLFHEIKVNKVLLLPNYFYKAQDNLLSLIYPLNKKLKVIAVTGTNGKTSTTYLAHQLCFRSKVSTLLIGSLGVFHNTKKVKDFALTTPSLIDLRKTVHQHQNKVDIVFVEASSHALDQGRFLGFDFFCAAWTNFTQDHLDYHQSMEEYFQAKLKLKKFLKGTLFVPANQGKLILKLKDYFEVQSVKPFEIYSNFYQAEFNRINLGLAVKLLEYCGISVSKESIEDVEVIPGRFQVIEDRGRIVIIDYAHTPDALENIISEVQKTYAGKTLKVIFGCGGDRDRSKRPLMAKAVERFCCEIYLTSDNPRTEDPNQIIEDTLTGFRNKEDVKVFVDRAECIRNAMKELSDQSVLLIAGKGSEPYLDIGGKKIPYSDEQQVRSELI
jgi:UDP-N-acetylmuramoyl-L-alanyl-D-glutamate--2,6-diaminopimelate ligase